METKTLLLVISTNQVETQRYVRAAEAAGVRVIVLGERRVLPQDYGDVLPVSQLSVEEASAALLDGGTECDGVLGVGLHGGVIAAHLGAQLGLAGHTPGGVGLTANRSRLLRRLQSADLPISEFHVFEEREWTEETVGELNFPVVFQPTLRTRLGPILRAESAGEMMELMETVWQSGSAGHAPREVACECVEASASTLVVAGLTHQGHFHLLALVDRDGDLENSRHTDTLFLSPSVQPDGVQELACRHTANACSALGLEDGPVQAFFHVSGDRLWLSDVAGHPLQGPTGRALRFGRGMSLEEVHVRHALRMEVDTSLQAGVMGTATTGVRETGVFQGIQGRERALTRLLIHEVETNVEVGQRVIATTHGGVSPAWILAFGSEREEIREGLLEGLKQVRVVVTP